MFEQLTALLTTLNSLSPLGILGLAIVMYFYQTKNVKAADEHSARLASIKGNDLHELPQMAENIRDMASTLQRMETANAAAFATVIARLNGGVHK